MAYGEGDLLSFLKKEGGSASVDDAVKALCLGDCTSARIKRIISRAAKKGIVYYDARGKMMYAIDRNLESLAERLKEQRTRAIGEFDRRIFDAVRRCVSGGHAYIVVGRGNGFVVSKCHQCGNFRMEFVKRTKRNR